MFLILLCLFSSFNVERLTFNSESDWIPTIAVDDSNKVHIACRYPGQIRYITNTSGSWVVDSILVSGETPSIAVTPAGTPHIAFAANDGNDDEVYYATYVGGVWDIDTVTDNSMSSKTTSIALAPDSTPHVVYYDFTGGLKIWHAVKELGTWNTEFIPGSDVGTYSSIAIDASGNAHVGIVTGAYGGNREIIYANNTSGSWVTESVTNDALDDDFPSIAVDKNGNVHISYEKNDGSDWELWYSTNSSGSFVAEQLTDNIGIHDGGYSSIAVDGGCKAHIAFHENHLVGDLFYITNKSGSWERETIFAQFSNKTYSWVDRNICIDDLGFIHACFANQLGGSGTQEVYHAVTDEPIGIETPSFYARTDDICINLHWSVEMEDECLLYIIVRKSLREGEDYVEIAKISGSGSSPSPKTYTYKDKDIEPGIRYYYKLGVVKTGGQTRWYGPVPAVATGIKGYLKISPNPFTSVVSVKCQVPSAKENISLKIYDISGRLVKSFPLTTNHLSLGTAFFWDGRDDRNKLLTPGIYFCELKTPDCVKREKILLVK